MSAYIKKRLLGFIIVLVGVSILSFLLITLFNTDSAELIARKSSITATDQMIEQVQIELGLDKPMITRCKA